jgi:ligand-binding SRPBCC domain-containing protein
MSSYHESGSEFLTQTHQLVREQWLPRSIEETFAFFSQPENLEEITPPWLGFRILKADTQLHTGSVIKYKLRIRGLPMRWTSEITVWEPPYRFVDNQLSGPYKRWHHEHTFASENGGTRIRDHVDYELPFGFLGDIVHALMVRRDVETIFRFRQQRLAELLGSQ